jgi:hypothetical protein
MPFETLLIDQLSPFIAGLLVNQPKPMPFIEMPGGLQALEGPKVNTTKALRNAMLHGVVHQSASDSCPARFLGRDEPTEMRTFFFSMRSVYGDGSLYSVSFHGQPDSIAPGLVLLKESDQPAGDLRLEGKAKPGKAAVVVGVEFGDAPDAAGCVSLLYG